MLSFDIQMRQIKLEHEVHHQTFYMRDPCATGINRSVFSKHTVMSQLEAPSLIEAPPNGSASCRMIVAPPENRSARRF